MRASLRPARGWPVGATLLMGGAAQAACTCTVDSLADPTDGGHTTLRDAVISAALPANMGSTITFASGLSDKITLGQRAAPHQPGDDDSGPGGGAADDQRQRREPPSLPQVGDRQGFPVTISGLTSRTGKKQSLEAGGAIYSYNANLTISNAVLSGNSGRRAGGGGANLGPNSTNGKLSDSRLDARRQLDRRRGGGAI